MRSLLAFMIAAAIFLQFIAPWFIAALLIYLERWPRP